jgi:hypothetical protein
MSEFESGITAAAVYTKKITGAGKECCLLR